MSNDLLTQLSVYGSHTREAREPVSATDVVNRVDQLQPTTAMRVPSGRRGWHVAVATAAVTLLIVGGVTWLLGGGAPTEPADGPELILPLEFPVSELPPFQIEVRYQLDSGVAAGPDAVPEDLEALMTVSYGGPDLLRVDVSRSVQLFFSASPEEVANGEPGPPPVAAGSFKVWNRDGTAEYAAADGTFFLLDRVAFRDPLDPLMWETWEDFCAFGEHEFLEASPVAGRETVHIRCTSGTKSYELWVDAETGLMLRIAGQDIPGNLILISHGKTVTEYEVLSVAYEPPFGPDIFSLSAPEGAIVEDLRGVDQPPETEALPEGTAVPELTGRFLAGGEFTLADLEGSRVALLFWGSWCEPCLDALDGLAVIANERPDITFITVLIQDRPEDALAVLAESQVDLPVVMPDGLPGNSYEEQWGLGIPLLVLVESDGTVAAYRPGFGTLDVFQGILENAGW